VPVIIKCPTCSKEFKVKPSHAKTRKYCSKECMAAGYTKEKLIRACLTCGKEFEVYNNKYRKDAKFCSNQCRGTHYSGENHPQYEHGFGNKHPEKMKEYRKRYYEENKDLCYQRAFIGKAKRREMEAGHTWEQWIQLLKEHDNKCFYCKKKMTKKEGPKQRTRDHIIPVSKGGTDDIENIVPACRSCNSSKGTREFELFCKGNRM
jgi:5-methylcytosine-specific restriction endonuclease McrA